MVYEMVFIRIGFCMLYIQFFGTSKPLSFIVQVELSLFIHYYVDMQK